MALENILVAIRAETEAAIARIRREGAARLAAATARFEAEAATVEAAAESAMDAAAAHRGDRIVNRARLDADHMLRSACERVYAEAVAEAEQRVAAMRTDPAYEALLGDLLEESLAVLPDAREVQIDPADQSLTERLLAGRGVHQLAVVPNLSTVGGLAVASGDGRRVVNTFEARRARAEPHLRRIAHEAMPVLRSGRR